MKRTKACPKCQSRDIIIIDGYTGGYGIGNNIPAGLTIFSHIPVDRYVCQECGYSEEWIRNEDIPKLKKARRAHLQI